MNISFWFPTTATLSNILNVHSSLKNSSPVFVISQIRLWMGLEVNAKRRGERKWRYFTVTSPKKHLQKSKNRDGRHRICEFTKRKCGSIEMNYNWNNIDKLFIKIKKNFFLNTEPASDKITRDSLQTRFERGWSLISIPRSEIFAYFEILCRGGREM